MNIVSRHLHFACFFPALSSFFVPVLMANIIHNGPSPLCCLRVHSKSDWPNETGME